MSWQMNWLGQGAEQNRSVWQIALYSGETQKLVSQHCWNREADRAAGDWYRRAPQDRRGSMQH